MSKFHAEDGHASREGIASLPNVGDPVPGLAQPKANLDGSMSSRASGISDHWLSLVQEGDLITGTIDISHERAHMVPPNDCAAEKKNVEEHLLSLQIIPPTYREGWTLDHDSNTTWFSRGLRAHHNDYATILIAPSVRDSQKISTAINEDNLRRCRHIMSYGVDTGRATGIDWSEGARGEYELIVLHPDHFLTDNFPILIKHPVTGAPTTFYLSEDKDGCLHEGDPTGPILPPLFSRGQIDRVVPLNPILVNYAAMLRFRRLIRHDLKWGSTLPDNAAEILRNVAVLHAAVNWKPDQFTHPELIIKCPDGVLFDLRRWRYPTPSGPLQLSSPAPGPSQGIQTGTPSTVLSRALANMEAGFVNPSDLYGDNGSESH